MVGAMKRAYAQATAPSNELLQRIQAAEKAIMKVDEVMNGNPAILGRSSRREVIKRFAAGRRGDCEFVVFDPKQNR